MGEHMVSSGGTSAVTLWSEDFGDPADPTLLLVAGGSQSAMSWPDALVRLLVGGGLHVVRYDHRDTGRSTTRDFDATPYDFDDLAADAVAVLDAWSVPAAHVVGFSTGGALAQLLALDHRERLLTLTLVGTSALDVDFLGNVARALSGEPTPDGLPTPRRWAVERVLHAQEPTDDEEAELDRRVEHWRALAGDELPFDADEVRRWERASIVHCGTVRPHTGNGRVSQSLLDRGADLADISTPTLVIDAPCDPINPPPHAEHLANTIPVAVREEIPGMGHALTAAVYRPLAEAILGHCGVV